MGKMGRWVPNFLGPIWALSYFQVTWKNSRFFGAIAHSEAFSIYYERRKSSNGKAGSQFQALQRICLSNVGKTTLLVKLCEHGIEPHLLHSNSTFFHS